MRQLRFTFFPKAPSVSAMRNLFCSLLICTHLSLASGNPTSHAPDEWVEAWIKGNLEWPQVYFGILAYMMPVLYPEGSTPSQAHRNFELSSPQLDRIASAMQRAHDAYKIDCKKAGNTLEERRRAVNDLVQRLFSRISWQCYCMVTVRKFPPTRPLEALSVPEAKRLAHSYRSHLSSVENPRSFAVEIGKLLARYLEGLENAESLDAKAKEIQCGSALAGEEEK